MKNKVIYAKCPYCKSPQPWNQFVVGQYSLSEDNCNCVSCGKDIIITAIETMIFTAKKKGL